ncbi:relaxase/mobilization nuclease domain-containing protein [Aquincola sp. J276]|uniref:relaxase/mobilization nuclease domain-containing protein n=1 Tax=Aquincola sp. J276 TaxID=2898432 RepID=UPI002151037A|nr:relaxase/mobilization nuclease domain-containing protein [Aquincola sp. J276]MCR5868193.1 relaxase/mobilization nuclease domain-containing protein [Aquincola sp. J276]
MTSTTETALLHWGERLFYPGNRRVANSAPHLRGTPTERAAALRQRIAAVVQRRAPQVMVKVTGGGRGMRAITAHFHYISKHGRLPMEDDRGESVRGREELGLLVDEWRWGGTHISEHTERREAYNVMLSMPRGTDPSIVLRAAREFAQTELADHKYVMVLHDHQANPHVHLSVRAESNHGRRLNPRKADLQRWRQTFAEKLRGWGIDAEATRAPTRGVRGRDEPLWQRQARAQQRLRRDAKRPPARIAPSQLAARQAWAHIGQALIRSDDPRDRALARHLAAFMQRTPGFDVSNRSVQRIMETDRRDRTSEPRR